MGHRAPIPWRRGAVAPTARPHTSLGQRQRKAVLVKSRANGPLSTCRDGRRVTRSGRALCPALNWRASRTRPGVVTHAASPHAPSVAFPAFEPLRLCVDLFPDTLLATTSSTSCSRVMAIAPTSSIRAASVAGPWLRRRPCRAGCWSGSGRRFSLATNRTRRGWKARRAVNPNARKVLRPGLSLGRCTDRPVANRQAALASRSNTAFAN